MKFVIIFTMLVLVTCPLFADRVCLDRISGALIEYQSGNAPLGTLTLNAVRAGYKEKDVEEKYVTREEWNQINDEQILQPIRDKEEEKKQNMEAKKELVKDKLGLNNKEFSDLKQSLGLE